MNSTSIFAQPVRVRAHYKRNTRRRKALQPARRMPPVEQFAWDDDNIFHCSAHKLSADQVDQVRDTRCVFFVNHSDQKASHLMIGPDRSGLFWTIAISQREVGLWYVHTGYQSSRKELAAYDAWVDRVSNQSGEPSEKENTKNTKD
jgi:hypothetical protein